MGLPKAMAYLDSQASDESYSDNEEENPDLQSMRLAVKHHYSNMTYRFYPCITTFENPALTSPLSLIHI